MTILKKEMKRGSDKVLDSAKYLSIGSTKTDIGYMVRIRVGDHYLLLSSVEAYELSKDLGIRADAVMGLNDDLEKAID